MKYMNNHYGTQRLFGKAGMNLQTFADDSSGDGEDAGGEDGESGADEEQEESEKNDKNQGKPKYSDEDLDRIIARKIAEERKKSDKSVREAQRLASMSAEERTQNELNDAKKQLEELRHQNAIDKMSKVARGILSDKSINLPDDLLLTMVTEDSKETKENVDSFAKLFEKAVNDAVTEKLKGRTPKAGTPAHGLTKADIDKIADRKERQRAIKDNINLYIGGN
jgi:hypothetical protein